jgi:ATPase subunit of ABC transporter with duplicated ATPase domains
LGVPEVVGNDVHSLAVVGPNGAGKSNFANSIQYGQGERVRLAEKVIINEFRGSQYVSLVQSMSQLAANGGVRRGTPWMWKIRNGEGDDVSLDNLIHHMLREWKSWDINTQKVRELKLLQLSACN